MFSTSGDHCPWRNEKRAQELAKSDTSEPAWPLGVKIYRMHDAHYLLTNPALRCEMSHQFTSVHGSRENLAATVSGFMVSVAMTTWKDRYKMLPGPGEVSGTFHRDKLSPGKTRSQTEADVSGGFELKLCVRTNYVRLPGAKDIISNSELLLCKTKCLTCRIITVIIHSLSPIRRKHLHDTTCFLQHVKEDSPLKRWFTGKARC